MSAKAGGWGCLADEGEKRGKWEKIEGKRKKRRENRDEGRERRKEREERGKWVPCATWTPRQHLTIILTPFDHFNDLSHNKG